MLLRIPQSLRSTTTARVCRVETPTSNLVTVRGWTLEPGEWAELLVRDGRCEASDWIALAERWGLSLRAIYWATRVATRLKIANTMSFNRERRPDPDSERLDNRPWGHRPPLSEGRFFDEITHVRKAFDVSSEGQRLQERVERLCADARTRYEAPLRKHAKHASVARLARTWHRARQCYGFRGIDGFRPPRKADALFCAYAIDPETFEHTIDRIQLRECIAITFGDEIAGRIAKRPYTQALSDFVITWDAPSVRTRALSRVRKTLMSRARGFNLPEDDVEDLITDYIGKERRRFLDDAVEALLTRKAWSQTGFGRKLINLKRDATNQSEILERERPVTESVDPDLSELSHLDFGRVLDQRAEQIQELLGTSAIPVLKVLAREGKLPQQELAQRAGTSVRTVQRVLQHARQHPDEVARLVRVE